MRIKITHTLWLEREPRNNNKEQLRQNARAGIQELIKSGITVSGMEKNDWKCIFLMVQDAKGISEYDELRQNSDIEIREKLTYIFYKQQTINLP